MAAHTLDSSAILAYYYREPGWQRMVRLFTSAGHGRDDLTMHAVNAGEVYYVAYRDSGEARARQVLTHLRNLPLRLQHRISIDLLREAGRLKATYPIAYADAYAVALARLSGGRLVTCDRSELSPLEARGEVHCLWLR